MIATNMYHDTSGGFYGYKGTETTPSVITNFYCIGSETTLIIHQIASQRFKAMVDEIKKTITKPKNWRYWHVFNVWPEPNILPLLVFKKVKLHLVQERNPIYQKIKCKRRAYLQELKVSYAKK